MTVCTGCSRPFKFLDTAHCEACTDALQVAGGAISKPKSEWPACTDCSKRFEFLSSAQCFTCKEKESQSMPPPALNPSQASGGPLLLQDQNRFSDIHHAMRNPTNPRTHGTPSLPYHNPLNLRRAELNENDVRTISFWIWTLILLTSFITASLYLCTSCLQWFSEWLCGCDGTNSSSHSGFKVKISRNWASILDSQASSSD